MTTDLAPASLPIDHRTGLILPLSRSLGSQELARHRAMVAVELEVMAKKMDRFGWERDRGSMAHDRLLTDWMDALQDFPLDEVKSACRAWVEKNPRKMPNEGDIRREILSVRANAVRAYQVANPQQSYEPPAERVTKEQAEAIMLEVGFRPKRFGGGETG